MKQNKKFLDRVWTYGHLVHAMVMSQMSEEMMPTVLNQVGSLLNQNQIK